jgi:nitroreductase
MELAEALRRRRMVRSFADRPVDPDLVDDLLAASLRAPSAGNTGGTAWLVLSGHEQTADYWTHTTTAEWRQKSRRWPGLSRAPVAALSLTSPDAYCARYQEPDKASSGTGTDNWPVPYWFGDAAFATMSLLLGATGAGLGACLLGNFRGEAPLLESLGVPAEWRLFGTVLVGHDSGTDHRSPSLDRPGPTTAERIHRGQWSG